ncbi:hypothetical protein [Nocardiopsis sp. NRRL B-16309]|uniref:hypothetical protein n=1 Tax=Nocardiopsis sp. NRRL B-16309 TaxID=1519494 RepID=UPI001E504DFA|nr:hypothetical protein [Nocardiopsis sp. NRRL B-16309]
MTRISVLAALGAAVWFTRADTVGALAGSLFLGAVLFCDAVRARMRANRRDALTVWLVSMLAQLREYIVYAGLAVGAVLAGLADGWGWAAGALIALALRDWLLIARAAPTAPDLSRDVGREPHARPGRTGGLLADLAPRPPEGPRESDPRLTGRLLGPGPGPGSGAAADARPGDGGAAAAPGGPPRPRISPEALTGRESPSARASLSREPERATAPPEGDRLARVQLPHLARRIMVFSQSTRFLAIAVTATLWDARVAFLTLIVGCAVAVTGELVDPRGGRR